MSTPAPNIFDTLAQHDTQLAQHDQMVTQAAQPNIFDQLAANNGQPGQAKPAGPQLVPNPKASEVPTFGESWQSPEQRLTMPLVKGLIAAHDKLREVENLTQGERTAHPVMAHIGDLANRIEGLLTGNEEHPEHAIGTGKYGMLTNPVLAAVSGAPAAAELAGSGETAIREGVSALRGGGEGPGIVKQVLKGREVAQEPAKAAIRTAAGAEDEAALLEGHETVLDKPLKGIAEKERVAYAKQDEAAGFDVKETRKKLSDAEYKVKQPEIDDAAKARLEKVITESKQNLAEAEKRMGEAGVDAKAADTLHRQRMAGQEFKKAVVSAVSSDGESVNVDRLLNASKKLRFSKYGDRLEQFMGKENADKYMEELQHAQEIGAHALKVQQIAKWAGAATGVGVLGHGAISVLTH